MDYALLRWCIVRYEKSNAAPRHCVGERPSSSSSCTHTVCHQGSLHPASKPLDTHARTHTHACARATRTLPHPAAMLLACIALAALGAPRLYASGQPLIRGAGSGAPPACTDGASCNVCKSCCHAYIPAGAACAQCAKEKCPVAPLTGVSVQGNKLVDQGGRDIVLRGASHSSTEYDKRTNACRSWLAGLVCRTSLPAVPAVSRECTLALPALPATCAPRPLRKCAARHDFRGLRIWGRRWWYWWYRCDRQRCWRQRVPGTTLSTRAPTHPPTTAATPTAAATTTPTHPTRAH